MAFDVPESVQTTSVLETSETYGWHAPATLTAEKEPQRLEKPRFTYRRSVLPLEGGRILLRLRRAPVIEVDPQTLECEVQGWGVLLPHAQIEEIDRRMARRFLELFSKATARVLTEQEEGAWLRVLDEVDYTSFSHDRAAPHYVEGTLVRQRPHCRIDWNDGTVESLAPQVAHALDNLEPNRFGAFAKLSSDGMTLALERVILLPEDEANVA